MLLSHTSGIARRGHEEYRILEERSNLGTHKYERKSLEKNIKLLQWEKQTNKSTTTTTYKQQDFFHWKLSVQGRILIAYGF